MKILITGGLGHIGSSLIRNLKDHDIIIVDNLSTQRYCSLFNIGRKFVFIEKDFDDLLTNDFIDVDVVIHLAAITDAASSFDSKTKINVEENNKLKTKLLINKIGYTNVKLLIFPSSTSVYGTSTSVVYEGDDSFINPQSPYAESKIYMERFIEESGISYSNLRLGTIFGPSPGMRFHTAINKFCYQAALNDPLTIWKQNYDQYRPYLGLNDAINAIKLVLKNPQTWNKTYNVLSDNYSLNEIVNIIQNIKPTKINFVNTPLLNQYSYKVNFDKIKKIGFTPQDNLEKEIKITIKMLTGEL